VAGPKWKNVKEKRQPCKKKPKRYHLRGKKTDQPSSEESALILTPWKQNPAADTSRRGPKIPSLDLFTVRGDPGIIKNFSSFSLVVNHPKPMKNEAWNELYVSVGTVNSLHPGRLE